MEARGPIVSPDDMRFRPMVPRGTGSPPGGERRGGQVSQGSRGPESGREAWRPGDGGPREWVQSGAGGVLPDVVEDVRKEVALMKRMTEESRIKQEEQAMILKEVLKALKETGKGGDGTGSRGSSRGSKSRSEKQRGDAHGGRSHKRRSGEKGSEGGSGKSKKRSRKGRRSDRSRSSSRSSESGSASETEDGRESRRERNQGKKRWKRKRKKKGE